MSARKPWPTPLLLLALTGCQLSPGMVPAKASASPKASPASVQDRPASSAGLSAPQLSTPAPLPAVQGYGIPIRSHLPLSSEALSGLNRLPGAAGQRLLANDGGGLLANDGGGLLANDGGGLLANDGGGFLSKEGNSLLANDGGGLLANDGGGLLANDGGGLLANDGGGFQAPAFKLTGVHRAPYGLLQKGAVSGLAISFIFADAPFEAPPEALNFANGQLYLYAFQAGYLNYVMREFARRRWKAGQVQAFDAETFVEEKDAGPTTANVETGPSGDDQGPVAWVYNVSRMLNPWRKGGRQGQPALRRAKPELAFQLLGRGPKESHGRVFWLPEPSNPGERLVYGTEFNLSKGQVWAEITVAQGEGSASGPAFRRVRWAFDRSPGGDTRVRVESLAVGLLAEGLAPRRRLVMVLPAHGQPVAALEEASATGAFAWKAGDEALKNQFAFPPEAPFQGPIPLAYPTDPEAGLFMTWPSRNFPGPKAAQEPPATASPGASAPVAPAKP